MSNSNVFTHTDKTRAPSIGGLYTPCNVPQKFTIVSTDHEDKNNYMSRTEANAVFMYKGLLISMSTSGLNHGACLNEVCVLEYKDQQDQFAEVIHKTHSVEEAIQWVDEKNNKFVEYNHEENNDNSLNSFGEQFIDHINKFR